ncbi:MAG: type II toxin-antitoxin system RelE/ParE family toxin [Planctomycetaceae bacterium]|nr:type II toxin-antitoxin system RelE/ParE family toxin [Planctomycetaceae bacterium]
MKLLLTQRALRDITQIKSYSIENWGERVSGEYLNAIEEALSQIKLHPEILRVEACFHPSLHFYRVRNHLLVCDFLKDSVVVLTVIHAVMDIPERLTELQPTFRREVEILRSQLHQANDDTEEEV